MTIKNRLRIICIVFSIIPLIIVYWLGSKSGLMANRSFENAITLALMSAILLGLFSSGIAKYWFVGKQLEKMKKFCLAVKDGHYDVFLPVPNESSDTEEENEMVELMRDMNWMAHHIQLNESKLQAMVHDLEKSQKQIQSQKDELEKAYTGQVVIRKQLEDHTHKLTEVVTKIRTLLDHAGQGFVSFGQDLVIMDEYSAECIMIFNREIAGESIVELLYPEDKKQQEFITKLLQKIFTIDDESIRETYASLLPQEILVDNNYIHIGYKFIDHSHAQNRKEIMLILTDVTKQKAMEKQIQEEKEILSMVVKVVTQYNDFSEAVEGYTAFCQQGMSTVLGKECSAQEKISTIFSMVHTWKGTFGQLSMFHIVKELHGLEGLLAKLREEKILDNIQLAKCLADYSTEKLYSWLSDELIILQEILGKQFLMQKNMIAIEQVKLEHIEQIVQQLPDSAQKQEVAAALEKLRYKPFRELLQNYPDYTVSLAKQYGKKVEPFTIIGGEKLVNPDTYHEFVQALTHIFRNAVAHGMETGEERLAVGKKEVGIIQCSVRECNEKLVLNIVDDGRGIDAEQIKKIAIKRGILTPEVSVGLSDEQAVQLIFEDGFSSTVYADEISGRGVGLYAVRKAVKAIGGHIELSTAIGGGTEFRFTLPV